MKDIKTTPPLAVFITLGCRSNQYDTAAMMAGAESAGYRVKELAGVPRTNEPVDCYVINTCAVTHKSAYQCRQMVRRARRQSPEAGIAATGCLARTSPDSLLAAGADIVAGPDERSRVIEYLGGQECREGPFFFHPEGGSQHKFRPVVKIQDGCASFCSYCIVPLARGKSRSLPAPEVLHQLKCLACRGFKEVVLTGVHLGLYGLDLGSSLTELLLKIDRAPAMPERVRLSSIEPQAVSEEFIEVIASSSLFCPHFHLPLQSGDAQVLAAMRRPYQPETCKEMIEKIASLVPSAGIGIDLMAGFPGETGKAHQNTVGLVKELPVSYFHVFPFSRRPGTDAAKMTEHVPDDIIKARAAELRQVGRQKRRSFLLSQVGNVLDVLFEKVSDNKATGISGNYIRVETEYQVNRGNITRMKITEALQESVRGSPP